LSFVLFACGGGEPAVSAPRSLAVDTSMAELAPADTVAFLHVR
jgi:hypothetical protein